MSEIRAIVVKLRNICDLVYHKLGPNHSEFVYHRALKAELQYHQIYYESEKNITVKYPVGPHFIDLSTYKIKYKGAIQLLNL